MDNPLLNPQGLPTFSAIAPEHVEPAIDQLLAEGRALVENLLADGGPYSWQSLIEPLEAFDDRLAQAWSPVSHMNSVVNTEALRAAYNACLPKLSDYATEMGQNEQLYQAYKQIADGEEYLGLDGAQRKVIDNALRDFRLSGIALEQAARDRYKEIMQELSSLHAKFEENLLDATNAWSRLITDETQLAGLPDSARSLARQNAEREEKEGWLFNLEFPSYLPVLTYADDRELREDMYTAFVTRASDEGPDAGQWDNSEIMEQLLALRHEAARLLGFDNYAERSLATKMAESTEHVMRFLTDLAERSLPAARAELDELRAFASAEYAMEDLEAWDIPYFAEKLRQHKYAISQEELKPYFPDTRVIAGMFEVVSRLYGLKIEVVEDVDTDRKSVV